MKNLFIYISLIVFINTNSFATSNKQKADSIFILIKTSPQDSLPKLYNLLSEYNLSENIEKAIENANKAIEYSIKFNDSKELILSHEYLGSAYTKKGELDKALDILQKGLEISKKANNKPKLVAFYNLLGVTSKNKGKYQQAIEYYQQGLKILEQTHDSLQMGYVQVNIGTVYFNFGIDYNKALDYYTHALVIFEKLGKKHYVAYLYNNIGLTHKERKDKAKALEFFNKGLKIFKEQNYDPGIAFSQDNLVTVYIENENLTMALKNSLSSMAIYRKMGDNQSLTSTYKNLGEIYFKLNDFETSLKYLKLSIQLAQDAQNKKTLSDIYKLVAQVYSTEGSYKEAYNYFQKHSAMKDSTLGEEYLKNMQEMESKYESDKKQKALELQQATIDKQDLESKRKSMVIWGFAFIVVVILVFSGLLFKQFKEKKRANDLLAQQNDEIKEQRDEIYHQKKEITDSIHYASRIQRAVLPPSRILEEYGLEHFILFKPRDIVSGDFYWMKNRDDKVILAAADCTGHGVPGAFMSMLGMAFLNEIVTKGDFKNAANILDQLRDHIINNLHQTGKAEETKDGMDISLCILDRNTNKMEFAGAFNSLYMVRNGELIEASADRMPIGVHDKLHIPFTNHVIDLKMGDSVYILSDGYIDQFGGTQSKKFMAKRFKQLLIDIQSYTMPQQRDFLNKTIEEWRGDIDQIDDIMVIGFKV